MDKRQNVSPELATRMTCCGPIEWYSSEPSNTVRKENMDSILGEQRHDESSDLRLVNVDVRVSLESKDMRADSAVAIPEMLW